MFSRISTLFAVTLFLAANLAVATDDHTVTKTVTETAPATTVTEPASQCNTGPVQCCNSVQNAGSPGASSLLSSLGVLVQDPNVPIGINCSPISAVGIGENSCNAQPVCCDDNNFNGLVAIGCVIVNVNA
ncbi:hypothetical protein VKT23_000218 [Stygiomarasmius scandens]|uniref:Hydrophobin n=1 Tax=Marasmiellus scandens TaxID=2682957 RepID=A0ABR1K659_9AGAR